MHCATCGSPLSQTRCGKNSKPVCPKGHPQVASPTQHAPDWAWAEWVQEQGIGE